MTNITGMRVKFERSTLLCCVACSVIHTLPSKVATLNLIAIKKLDVLSLETKVFQKLNFPGDICHRNLIQAIAPCFPHRLLKWRRVRYVYILRLNV